MDRRTWLKFAGAAAAATVLPYPGEAQEAPPQTQTGFSEEWLDALAKSLAGKSYTAPERRLDGALENLGYDQYRDIRYKPDNAIWRNDNLPFRVELFHTGGRFYAFPVDLFIVEAGRARIIDYEPGLFNFGPLISPPPAPDSDSGFAGFRVHAQLNKPNVFDEFLVFLGASYFRAIAAGQVYGLSARALAINTGQGSGEEFPLFRSFWIERPMPGNEKITIHALLDSISTVGRYKFQVQPGRYTVIEVEAVLYPRTQVGYAGVCPLTSMFFFGPNNQPKRNDYRPRVHDSDMLVMWTGGGEWIARPLINPERLQFSIFTDRNPKGFGLLQSPREFSAYQDLEALYEKRPSLWIEPLEAWGEGTIDLIEIPATEEHQDNIVCFWRPKDGIGPGRENRFRYRMHWGWEPPVKSNKATVSQTRVGQTPSGSALFIVDFSNTETCDVCTGEAPALALSTTGGEVRNSILTRNTVTGGHRLSFEYVPAGRNTADLRAVLTVANQPASETWIYRWAL